MTVANWYVFSLDGCKNYRVLSGADRSQGNAVFNNLCDSTLTPGWHRFQGAAGDRMADKCVPKYHCGSNLTVWFDDRHPTVDEGVVLRKVCYHGWGSSCCEWIDNIRVKNCSAFYVYELQKMYFCNVRYCGNGGKLISVASLSVLVPSSSFFLKVEN